MSDQNTVASGQTNTDTATPTDAATSAAPATLLDGTAAADAASTGSTTAGAGDTTQTGDGATATGQAGKPKDDAEVVPEQYADFTLPDGVEFNADVLGEFKSTAKELGLSQAKAQKVTDLGAKLVQATMAKQAEAIASEQAKWETASRSDKEFGGAALKENLGIATTALDQFGTPELKTMLRESGLGNHPEVIRLLHRVGKAVSEDKTVRGGAVTPADNSAKSFYPNSNMN